MRRVSAEGPAFGAGQCGTDILVCQAERNAATSRKLQNEGTGFQTRPGGAQLRESPKLFRVSVNSTPSVFL